MKRIICRGCGSKNLRLLYDFGQQPLAGHFPANVIDSLGAKRYPLDLSQCSHCGLLQVTTLPPIDEVFNDDYRYSTSTIPSLVEHFKQYAKWIGLCLPVGSRILEFGCNDGALLTVLADKGYICKGVDASGNIVALARSKGLDVDEGFFNLKYVVDHSLESTYDFITCSNVFAHIDNLNEITLSAWTALKPNGLFCIEVHDGNTIYSEDQFDTIYHEHLSYFTSDSIKAHLDLNGFELVSDIRTDMHGGGG